MKENLKQDIRALVRIIAFAISKCTSGADDLVSWAYEENAPCPNPHGYIDKFLSTDGRVMAPIKQEFISRFIENGETFPVEAVKSVILHMPYEEFLKTPYWKAIAQYVKKRDYNRCQLCGAQKHLHVHHKTYQHHGDELHHLQDLVTLCKKCHSKTHDERRIHTNSQGD